MRDSTFRKECSQWSSKLQVVKTRRASSFCLLRRHLIWKQPGLGYSTGSNLLETLPQTIYRANDCVSFKAEFECLADICSWF